MDGSLVPAGTWVRIHRVELAPPERAPAIPDETAAVAFESWVNGRLVDDSAIGSRTRIRTTTGRLVEGDLVEVSPGYRHTFGSPPASLLRAGERAREILFPGGVR